jgi:hypothetical protein
VQLAVIGRVLLRNMVCHLVCQTPGHDGEAIGMVELVAWVEQHPHLIKFQPLQVLGCQHAREPRLWLFRLHLSIVAVCQHRPNILDLDCIQRLRNLGMKGSEADFDNDNTICTIDLLVDYAE